MIAVYILLGILAVLVIFSIAAYNSLVRLDNKVKEAFSTMDVYLKKRWDLIPKLVETVKAYAQHEKTLLEGVTERRAAVYENLTDNAKIATNEELTQDISKIMALSEAYPTLGSNENFMQLSGELSKIEDDIANARKYYNGSVRLYNTKVELFPTNLYAKLFKYERKPMYEAQAVERKDVSVDFGE